MRAGERLFGDDGREVMLFPLPYMYISQGENEPYSHAGTLNIDFLGWNSNGRVYQCDYYAPCSCKCVRVFGSGADANGRVYESLDMVHTPNGLQYVSFLFFHDDNPPSTLGSVFTQGDLIGHTGTEGYVTGDHVHMNCANGLYAGYEHVPPDNMGQLVNSTHIYDICYVNDTVLVNDYGYNWVEYSGGIIPSFSRRNGKFPWVLYANKIRNRQTFDNSNNI